MNNQNNGQGKRVVQEQFQAYGQYSYTAQFEDTAQTGQTGAPQQNSAGTAPVAPPPHKPAPRRSGGGFFRFFVLLSILTIGIVVMLQTVFRLEAVCVIGHENRTAQEVINASGLTYGQSIFSIREKDVQVSLEQDYTLIFKGLQVKHPNLVYLQVEERKPVAIMQWLGVHYVLDKDGLVMDETTSTELIGSLPVVTGFRVSSAHKGHYLTVKSQTQLDAYTKLIDELTKQNYAGQITEIRLSDPENIYLVTVEGISVRIGMPEELKRKLQSVRTTISFLRGLDEDAGVLDVSTYNDVKYRPDN